MSTHHTQARPWHPPEPSFDDLPLDSTKTDPTPAYYKLQFGDEETGFSYYVRTLSVVIGRNCERQDVVPPPAITNPSVPTNPPLDPNQPSPPNLFRSNILRTPPVADFPSPPANQPLSVGPPSPSTSAPKNLDGEVVPTEPAPPDVQQGQDGKDGLTEEVELEPRVETVCEGGHGLLAESVEGMRQQSVASHDDAVASQEHIQSDIQVKLEEDVPPPPPPPPRSLKANIEHVDVDLGPLKSVSRNHAKIEYSTDLGRFCLEILGRNGAWIDERYYVKGSIVPLAQGSQIQIATRIFSFILPPSFDQSPDYNYYNGPIENYENLPYPYNLPANEVHYDEFFGEGGPGPASAASMAARQPPAFNAFAASHGYGLGLGMDDPIEWGHWESERESDDSSSSLSWEDDQDWDEDVEEEEEINGNEIEEEDDDNYETGTMQRQNVKTKPKKPVFVSSEDESELSSMDSEPELPLKKSKRTIPLPKRKVERHASSRKRRETVIEDLNNDKSKQLEGSKAKVQAKKGAKSKKPVKEEAREANEKETSTSIPPTDDKPLTTPTKSKGKKAKTETNEVVACENKEKLPIRKESKKKVKSAVEPKSSAPASNPTQVQEQAPEGAAAKSTPPKPKLALPPQLPKPTPSPVPTLAAAMAATPIIPASAPSSQNTVRPQQQTVRPPGPGQPHVARLPGQSGQFGQQPIATRPPSQPGIRPPGQPYQQQLSRPSQPHPTHQQYRPQASSVRPPVQPVQRLSQPSPIPQIQSPFYCTELNETPGRPGHIIVNVPIPPSGAGPRPPPGPILGLDGKPFIGPPPLKPTQTFATIIHKALSCLPRGRGTLGEVCNWVAGEWEWFRLNVDSGWQNSIRHNLSLNKAFLKVPRIPEDDPESKGSVWIIDPQEGPLFEEKQRRDALKAAGKDKNAESRREKERVRAEERAKKQREAAIEAARNPQMHNNYTRAMPPMVRPVVRPPVPTQPAPQSTASQPVTANIKGVLQPKAKIVVVMQSITPAMRTKSVIATRDSNGNPLPFVCDGTTLVLDQQTFGHLTSDILEKLTSLGAAGAVDVLSAWVINKNKQQNKTGVNTKPVPSGLVKNGTTNGAARPPNGTQPLMRSGQDTANKTTSNVAPKHSAIAVGSNTIPAVSSASAATSKAAPHKLFPGPAPPGTSLTKVIGMIAEVANAKGNVNVVGPNASALLRYIRVVGVDIDLRVAERIWATGVVPPLPVKKVAKTGQQLTQPGQATKPVQHPWIAAQPALDGETQASIQVSGTSTAAAGLKRKLDEGAATINTGTPGVANTNSAGVGASSATNTNMSGGSNVEQEAKKPRLETSSA
ncbi:uncharacterized protein L203_105702 [Cryptococcus depauperatus CBS 7841]|uniref:Uncharacterized protein n=1 Tax=Cryptococcus depauperatus CBS 7841 TaxID=1295531 RepID=A0A1E3IH94_9TREE|nr:hypothetical protein L203_03578 [Cryptococcus depauperatus CBS 7841]